MDYVFLIISSVIVLTCFYFIISPLFIRNVEEVVEGEDPDALSLEAIYGAVNELEMDYLMKKINEKDYLELKEQYQYLASQVSALDSKPKKKKSTGKQSEMIDLEILGELKKLRKQGGR